jgi:hypothetical protein
VAERWLCNRLEPQDCLRITQILICDGFILGETLDSLTRLLLSTVYNVPFTTRRVHFKGELRDIICRATNGLTPREEQLIWGFKDNPDYFYVEAPVDGTVCLDPEGRLLALYRIKRPRRIAEKANRYIAGWIFHMVRERAQQMAEERARHIGIPLEHLLTPEEEMASEFILAEETIAQAFREGKARLNKKALTINDVGGIKVIGEKGMLARVEAFLLDHPTIKILEREEHHGTYQARSLIIEVPWSKDQVCRSYLASKAWEKYRDRGIPEKKLMKGIDSLLEGTASAICLELILSTSPDLIESELGMSIHEERITAQRNRKVYRGYIPMNVEFLIEYLFAVALSPKSRIDRLPVKLWGRYLPDTISYHIRQLYYLSEHDALY